MAIEILTLTGSSLAVWDLQSRTLVHGFVIHLLVILLLQKQDLGLFASYRLCEGHFLFSHTPKLP
ncbi:hypothetical protein Ataiwa_39820 [Algoriphagus taiwanensis]|uniref:Uncharacterized protein n=2 Tax=Algoriphagus taiwanensis TaxID=1445656 RepID=A0ABQ6Q6A0_9BACT|nr:hypothetical protein Ataiwa_39820 [Algoriphagus taiwanensis]